MTGPGATLIDSRTVYEGRIIKVTLDRVHLPHGREARLEVVRHPGSVVLVPMPDPQHVILVRQYRYVINRWIWELPAGSIDAGEDPETAARRECHEEIGQVPGAAQEIGRFYPTPGYCDELMIFYRLTDLRTPTEAAVQDEDEQLEPRAFALDDVRAMVRRGEIQDLKTALGVTLL